jgi:hypothetical protein
MGNRHPPSFSPVLNSSPSSLTQCSPDQSGLPPLSSPWACRVKWFDLHGNSLDFAPGPLPELPRPCSQQWHVPLVHHPTLLRHPRLHPRRQPLCPLWTMVTCTRKNSMWRCLITRSSSSRSAFRTRASGIQFQFSRTRSLRSDGTLMIFSLDWSTWTDELRKLNLYSRLSSIPCILQTQASMPPLL